MATSTTIAAEEQLLADIEVLLENDRQCYKNGKHALICMNRIQHTQEKTILELQRSNRILQSQLRDIHNKCEEELVHIEIKQHNNREAIGRTVKRYVKQAKSQSKTDVDEVA